MAVHIVPNGQWNVPKNFFTFFPAPKLKLLLVSFLVPKLKFSPLSFFNIFINFSEIVGPTGTPYEGGIFQLEIDVPER